MISFKIFKKYQNIVQGILERKDGLVNLTDPKSIECILNALRKLKYKAEIENLIFAQQIHGKNIYFCPPNLSGYLKFNADGLITETPGQILVIRTADCIPLLIWDPAQKKIGAIHVGRKGLFEGIVENALRLIGGRTKNFKVGIGPHIRKCCYSFQAKDYLEMKSWQKYFQKKNKKFYLDLTKILLEKLRKLGLKEKNIEDCRICTFCQAERFYSARKIKKAYQKEKPFCFATFIGLKKN